MYPATDGQQKENSKKQTHMLEHPPPPGCLGRLRFAKIDPYAWPPLAAGDGQENKTHFKKTICLCPLAGRLRRLRKMWCMAQYCSDGMHSDSHKIKCHTRWVKQGNTLHVAIPEWKTVWLLKMEAVALCHARWCVVAVEDGHACTVFHAPWMSMWCKCMPECVGPSRTAMHALVYPDEAHACWYEHNSLCMWPSQTDDMAAQHKDPYTPAVPDGQDKNNTIQTDHMLEGPPCWPSETAEKKKKT
jgi:hypothetical protein